jgi:hypothetical protein
MGDVSEPTNADRRRSPRIEVFAQAEVVGQDIRIMEIRNISTEGVFLMGTAADYPDLVPGVDIDLAISTVAVDSERDPDANIACRARIVRIDPGEPGQRPAGFGATIAPIDDENRERLVKLLAQAAG